VPAEELAEDGRPSSSSLAPPFATFYGHACARGSIIRLHL
jgi:hypothetical protein